MVLSDIGSAWRPCDMPFESPAIRYFGEAIAYLDLLSDWIPGACAHAIWLNLKAIVCDMGFCLAVDI